MKFTIKSVEGRIEGIPVRVWYLSSNIFSSMYFTTWQGVINHLIREKCI